MVLQAGMPLDNWVYVIRTFVYVLNRLPTITLVQQILYTLLFQKPLNLDFFRSFGSRCYICLRAYDKPKFQPRLIACNFLGYAPQYKCYFFFNTDSNRLYVSQHIIFNKSHYLFLQYANIKIPISEYLSVCFPVPIQPISLVTFVSLITSTTLPTFANAMTVFGSFSHHCPLNHMCCHYLTHIE